MGLALEIDMRSVPGCYNALRRACIPFRLTDYDLIEATLETNFRRETMSKPEFPR